MGDEICDSDAGKGIVTYIYKNNVDILWNDDGSVSESIDIKDLERTGRTFPEIIEFLINRKNE